MRMLSTIDSGPTLRGASAIVAVCLGALCAEWGHADASVLAGAPVEVVAQPETDSIPETSRDVEPAGTLAAIPEGSVGAEVAEPGSAMGPGLVVTGATPHRLVLFTFDDGPDPRTTPRLLEALDAAHVRALFFVTTRRFAGTLPHERASAAVLREIARRGHAIGSHGMDHLQLPLVSDADLAEQVDASLDLIERVTGQRPFLFRPPGGSLSPRIHGYLASRSLTTVLWNLGTGDVQVRESDAVLTTFRRVFERQRALGERGGIVLLHDIHPWSIDAFSRIVALFDHANCALLERGEELFDFVDDPTMFVHPLGNEPPGTLAPSLVLSESVHRERQERARERAVRRCGL